MFARLICVLVAFGLATAGLTGCDRPKSTAPAEKLDEVANTNLPSPPRLGSGQGEVSNPPGDVSTIHWLGKKRLATDTNAASVMAIWNLPETARLGTQTLEKLALAPWRLLKNDAATNGAPVALLRPLLDDLVTEEWHLVIHHPTNQPAAWSLAIKLPAERFPLWQTNLAAVLESLTGAKATQTSDGFNCPSSILHPPSSDFVFRLSRTNDWIMLGFAPQYSKPETRNSELGNGSLQSALRRPPPVPTNWLSLSLDPAALNRAFSFGWSLPANCPRVDLAMTGSDQSVQTRGSLTFVQPPSIHLQAWNIPTNLVQEPLVGFTALRGVAHWLDLKTFDNSLPVPTLTQLFGWSVQGSPLQTYLAAPVPNASNLVAAISTYLIDRSRQYFSTNPLGHIEQTPRGGLQWVELPFLPASLEATNITPGEFILAGWSPVLPRPRPIPDALLAQFIASTNLLYYDWEITQPRVEGWIYLAQTFRWVGHLAQLPPNGHAQVWLKAISTNLQNCVTRAVLVDPSHVAIARKSTIGFTAMELQFLADWLESPSYPSGLHSLEVEPDPRLYYIPKSKRATPALSTNAPSIVR